VTGAVKRIWQVEAEPIFVAVPMIKFDGKWKKDGWMGIAEFGEDIKHKYL